MKFPDFKQNVECRLLRGAEWKRFKDEVIADPDILDDLTFNPVPLKAQEATIEKAANVELAEGEDFALKFVISSSKRDRDNDTIAVDGWHLDSYEKNPIVLYGHDHYTPPIARSPAIAKTRNKLIAVARFPLPEVSEFGNMIGRLAKHKFLNMASVGFKPVRFEINEDERGLDFMEQELWEWSIVPIGSNPDALQMAKSVGINLDPLRTWAEEVLDTFKDGVPPPVVVNGSAKVHDPQLEHDDVMRIYRLTSETKIGLPKDGKLFDEPYIEPVKTLPEDAEWVPPSEEEWAKDAGHQEIPHALAHHCADGALCWNGVKSAMAMALENEETSRKAYDHLAEHYKEFSREAPDFKWVQAGVLGYAHELYELDAEGQLVLRDIDALDFHEAIDAMETLCGGTEGFAVPDLDRKQLYDRLTLRYARERVLIPEWRHVEAQTLKNFADRFVINANGEIIDKEIRKQPDELEIDITEEEPDGFEIDPDDIQSAVRSLTGKLD